MGAAKMTTDGGLPVSTRVSARQTKSAALHTRCRRGLSFLRRPLLIGLTMMLAMGAVPPAGAAVPGAGPDRSSADGRAGDQARSVPHPLKQERSVKGRNLPVRPLSKTLAETRVLRRPPDVVWPAPATADVSPPAAGADARAVTGSVQAGDLPVRVSAPAYAGRTDIDVDNSLAGAETSPGGTASVPGRVRVEVLGRDAAAAADIEGLLLRLRRTDDVAATGRLAVEVDYSGFRYAYGGDWGARLQLVYLVGCVVDGSSAKGCGRVAPVQSSRNDADRGVVSGEITVASAQGTLVALAAAPSGSTGDYKATSLAPSGSWNVAEQSGTFNWSYPLRVPQVPGGLAPELGLSYSSDAVDGRVASTNNQPSWLGEGWNLWPGFIERRYKGCADDTAGGSPKTGDLCWALENATASFDGKASRMVLDATTRKWRPEADDGSRVEQLFGRSNGDDNGEYWRITTTDGTQYLFGSRPEAQSTWTVPVFGNQTNEPCHGATFATSRCDQAYRWNLDKVVDPHGNVIVYNYAKETNSYGVNMASAVASYTRGGTLESAEYGLREGAADPAQARVVFGTADRCLGGDCSQHTTANWPDTPWDQECSATSCPDKYSPTFWSVKRLASITTQVRDGSEYRDVDVWNLSHTFPTPGDGTSPALWLAGVTHTGKVGGTISTPAITFGGLPLQNRVNTAGDGLPPMDKYRLSSINTESGGVLGVNYAPADCAAGALPAPDTNTSRCMPVRWMPEGGQPFNDWFHKYVVEQVDEVDRIGGNPTTVTSYDYEGGAAWAYDDDPLSNNEHRSWTQWRGYGKVLVRKGDPKDGTSPQSATRSVYFRGMDGDRTAAGGTKSVQVTDSEGVSVPDAEPLAGFVREEITYNGVDGPIISGVINDSWQRGPTATQGVWKSFMVRVGKSRTREPLAGGGWRRTETATTFDDLGMPTQINDLGDTSTSGDDQCTRINYARNTTTWLLDRPNREEKVRVACTATPALPADVISDIRTFYDGGGFGDAPSAGDVTKAEEAASYSGGTPAYVTGTRATFDAYGRVKESYDALNRKTIIAYAPATGLATSVTVTNPAGHQTVTQMEPAWDVPLSTETTGHPDGKTRRTDLTYDPLGRLTGVWLPGRSRAEGYGPNLRFGYGLRNDGPSWTSTEALSAGGAYVKSFELLDGLSRPRQTQAPAWGGGRVVTDTFHDSRGLQVRTNSAYHNPDAPGANLLVVADNDVPGQTKSQFDGAERPTASIFNKFGVEQWRTTTTYEGADRTSVTPPAGGIPTTTITDADHRTTELRQYDAATPTGTYRSTRYTYTKGGELNTITDNEGNNWTYTYDLRGRKVKVDDPDKGSSTMTYDDADQLTTMTDGRGTTLAYAYDPLGRKTALFKNSPNGTKLASWTYDTVVLGQQSAATRYTGGQTYTQQITQYDAANRPTEQKLTVPAAEGAAKWCNTEAATCTFTTTTQYRIDGSPATVALPALGNLAAETLAWSYDSLGMPLTTTGAAKYVTDTRYTPYGEPARLQFGEAGTRVWQSLYYLEGTRRLGQSWIEQEKPGATQVDNTRYSYEPSGNVTKISALTGSTASDVQCFGYDRYRQLAEAWTSTDDCVGRAGTSVGGVAPYWTSYRYNSIGARTSEVKHGLAGATDSVTTTTYPAAGQPRPHAPASITTTGGGQGRIGSYGYDPAGNTTTRPGPSDDAQTLAWDDEGELASVTSNGMTTDYIYTADGTRLINRDEAGATLYLGGGQIRLDKATGARTGTRYYQHGAATVAARTGGGVQYLFGDHHGTSDLAVTATTLQATKRRSDPFGSPRGTPPASWPGDRGFVGGINDASTGLTRLGARDYDPATGAFISVDPLLDTNDPQQFAAYSYAGNNPTTNSDPTGLLGCPGPDGIGCGSRVSKEGYCMSCTNYRWVNGRKQLGARYYHAARLRWLSSYRRAQADYARNERRRAHRTGIRQNCPDGYCSASHIAFRNAALAEQRKAAAVRRGVAAISALNELRDELTGAAPIYRCVFVEATWGDCGQGALAIASFAAPFLKIGSAASKGLQLAQGVLPGLGKGLSRVANSPMGKAWNRLGDISRTAGPSWMKKVWIRTPLAIGNGGVGFLANSFCGGFEDAGNRIACGAAVGLWQGATQGFLFSSDLRVSLMTGPTGAILNGTWLEVARGIDPCFGVHGVGGC